jgi:formate/nitrite transporter
MSVSDSAQPGPVDGRRALAPRFDALLPAEMAAKAEEVGVQKTRLDAGRLFALAVLAGAFVALGAVFSTTVAAGVPGVLPYGVTRLLSGVVFSLGLVLVVVGGAELFTGNTLIVMAWASRRVTARQVARNWTIVYAGNLVGALATALLVFAGGQHRFGEGAVGAAVLEIAAAKCSHAPGAAVALGVMCNGLVCLAVWLSLSARSTTDRILSVVPPISAFVTVGFEHSVANMYFVPAGLMVKAWAEPSFWTAIGSTPDHFAVLTWLNFLIRNLLPVTLGNIVGGSALVGGLYWFVYGRQPGGVSPARFRSDGGSGGRI